MSWIECVADKDYQIFSEEPYQLRRKSNKRIVKESIHKTTGYIRCMLNQVEYAKHRILALQFLPNPNNYNEVDHINRIRTDNRLENLRYVSHSSNQRNKTSYGNYNYNYVNEISDNSFEIDEYGNHRFTNYWYDIDADKFYYFTDHQYRELQICKQSNTGFFVRAFDINNVQVRIGIIKFKKLYNINI